MKQGHVATVVEVVVVVVAVVVVVVLVVGAVVVVVVVDVVTAASGAQTILATNGLPLRVPNWSTITTPGRGARGQLTL